MTDKEKVMWSLARCSCGVPDACRDCHYDSYPQRICVQHLASDAHAMLKAQEPRLITEDDFRNADECGYIPAWCESVSGLYAECITVYALTDTDFRYWTSRPTDEQMKAVKWNDKPRSD